MATKDKKSKPSEKEEKVLSAEELAKLSEYGEVDEELSAQSEEVDPFAAIPTFNVNKPGFEEGQVKAGIFVRTKRVVSDNFAAGRVDPETGERYRNLHILSNRAGDKKFGIWSVGQLGAAMRCLQPGDYVEIKYTGQGEPLKKGQDGPYTFTFKGRRANGGKLEFDWDQIEEAGHKAAAASVTPPTTSAHQ